MSETLLKLTNVVKTYELKNGMFKAPSLLKAVNGVSFEVKKGETVSIVGESGCGKTTTGKLVMRIEEPTEGDILFGGQNIAHLSREGLRDYRTKVQIIFQDPYSSLNPRWKVGDIIGEPLVLNTKLSKTEIKERVLELMDRVGLLKDWYDRYPHQFSGGQRQRIGIARALALHPELIVCDEPVSALDVSVQAQVLNLLAELQETFGLTYVFISHDLGVVRHVSDRVVVMYLGRVVETATTEELFTNPKHPYTRALLSAVPEVHGERRERIVLEGDLPNPVDPPSGCTFRTRCPHATDACASVSMELKEINGDHSSACPFYL